MPTLSELITEQKQRRGFSYADLENRADSAIRRQRWQQLGTGVRIKEFPEPATIEAMAKALDVDVAVVVLAAARSIGLDVKRGAQSDLAAMLPYSANKLSADQRVAIAALVRSITDRDADTRPSGDAGDAQTSIPSLEQMDFEIETLLTIDRLLANANHDADVLAAARGVIENSPTLARSRHVLFSWPAGNERLARIEQLAARISERLDNEMADRRRLEQLSAAARRGVGATKGEQIKDRDAAIGEHSQIDPEDRD